MKFRSERLEYREFTENDFSLFYSVFSNAQVMRYAYIDKVDCEEELRPYFKRVLSNNITHENRQAYEFAINFNDSFIGFADIEIHTKNSAGGCGEIGYFLLPGFWGSGYATEIARSLTAICFKQLGLHRVTARCNANNLKSENIMKKVGMVKEGELRKTRFKNGQWDDEKNYSILLEEWKENDSKIPEIISL